MDSGRTQYRITPATRALVVGLGRSGYAAARLVKRFGGDVVATDSSPRERIDAEVLSWLEGYGVDVRFGALQAGLLDGINLVVPSPGVPLDQPFFRAAQEQGVDIVGELALASEMYGKPIIGVTGTNGKSTVTELIGGMLRAAGRKPFVGGNLGVPLAEHILSGEESEMAVLETSSFQLDTAPFFKPAIALLLNITPDHLDRYRGYEEYIDSKFLIFKDQDRADYAVLNCDDPMIRERLPEFATHATMASFGLNSEEALVSAAIDGEVIRVHLNNGHENELYDMTGTPFAAEPNVHNAAAAILAARLAGCPSPGITTALHDFTPLGHRLALVGEWAGVRYFDDSKATNIGALSAALSGFETPVVLIAGGRDKGGDYGVLVEQVRKKVKAMVLIGEAKKRMKETFRNVTKVVFATSMADAVEKAAQLAGKGESVLLSPACASFDMFDSYSHRGNVFREAVGTAMKNVEV